MRISRDIANLLAATLRKEGWLELPAQGRSMFPLIRQGDSCRFVPCPASSAAKGDVLLYYAETERLVAHRLLKVVRVDGESFYVLKGDANVVCDPPIREDRILGKLAAVSRGKASLSADALVFRLWGRLTLAAPRLGRALYRAATKPRLATTEASS